MLVNDNELISFNAKVAKSFAKIAEKEPLAYLCEFLCALCVKVNA